MIRPALHGVSPWPGCHLAPCFPWCGDLNMPVRAGLRTAIGQACTSIRSSYRRNALIRRVSYAGTKRRWAPIRAGDMRVLIGL
jgi:hypothetical protein